MCIFIDNWDCNFAGMEITLDICKTCIDAKRLYHETKHDRALQERKIKMEEMSREENLEQETVPKREKKKKEPKSPIDGLVEETSTKKTDEKGFLDILEEEALTDNTEEEDLQDIIEEENVESEGSVEKLEPASIIEMKNLKGSIEDIQDDPTRPTDTWLETKEEDEDSLLKAEFPNPPDKLQSGEYKQEFLVRVRKTEDEFFFPAHPEINVKICEDGDVVAQTGRKEIKDVHGEVVSLKWNAGRLLDLYGTGVEIIVEGFGARDDGIKNRIEIGAVGWRANLIESKSTRNSSKEQTLEEKILSPLIDDSEDETIDAIKSDINHL